MFVLEDLVGLVRNLSLDEILDNVSGSCEAECQSKRGNIYEKIWDIIIKFGICDLFPMDEYLHYYGNMNTRNLKEIKNIKKYIQSTLVFSKNAGGSSDISLQRRKDDTWIFMTSKFYVDDDTKSIKDYDVQDILKELTIKNEPIYKKYEIYLLVNDGQKVKNIIENSHRTNKTIRDNIKKVLDKKDLRFYFEKFQRYIRENVCLNFFSKKSVFQMRFHQDMITYKIMEQIKKGSTQILLGAKPRSGKTYCIGGLFIKFYNRYRKLNALIVTPAPNETITQFTRDMFENYRDFDIFSIIEIRSGSELKNMKTQKNNIIIISKQLLDDYTGRDTIQAIKNLDLNFIISDENHFHGTTDRSKRIMNSYSNSLTIRVFLTATYFKPLMEWNIPENCQFYWDIEDEQLCKKRDISQLIEKHGSCVPLFLSDERVLSIYDNMPDLHIITNFMDIDRYKHIKEKIRDTDFGFSLSTLLSLTRNMKSFNYPKEVDDVLEYITGHGKKQKVMRDDKAIFERIMAISAETGNRTKLNNNDFTTQLWFLPYGQGMNIEKVSECLKKRMEKNYALSKYDIMIINSKKEYKLKDIKTEISNRELQAYEDGKDGLILLAGNQLTLGISLPLVDIIILLNDSSSADKIIQMMYRCMTEASSNYINSEPKKLGFVIDLNISRVLSTIVEYPIYKKDLNVEQKLSYIIQNDLINIDSDIYNNKENKSKLVERLMFLWKSSPVNNLHKLMKKMENLVINIEPAEQKELNRLFSKRDKCYENLKKTLYDTENFQPIQNGRKISVEKFEKEKTTDIILTKDVLPFVVPFSCLLTLKEKTTDIVEIFDIISSDINLVIVFNEQTKNWWNVTNILQFFRQLLEKYVKKDSVIYNISIQIKMTLESLVDKPKELLEFIGEHLKPKQKEKKELGEVFTPMELVFEMIDKLDEIYKSSNLGKSIFSNPNLKWGDIAGSGMGNFSVGVYIRLMEGLKKIIPNFLDRKRHILEKMLYMAEINKKNVYICKQIFDIHGEFKMNIYEGNTFDLNPQDEWKVPEFDIILGNPPYNISGTRSTGNTKWQLFLKNSLEFLKKQGYLCLIHPNGWRKPNTTRGRFYGLFGELTKKNTILYLEIHDNKDGAKVFHCGTRYDWYILQKTPNNGVKTHILDQNKVLNKLDLSKYNWLANCELNLIYRLMAKNNEEKCKIIPSTSNYETRKKWTSITKTEEYKYPLIHSTPKNGTRYYYSSRNDNGHFGVSKIIFGDSGIYKAIIDIEGKYGMTEHSMAICIDSLNEGLEIKKAIESEMFTKILNACSWSNFQIDWRLFTYFKKDFWKEFRER